MLTGSWKRGIDQKNRLVVPAELRDAFFMGGYASDQGSYVGLFPAQEFRDFVARIQRDVESKIVDRKLLRTVASNAYPFNLDTAGRVLIPATLRDRLPSDRDLVIVGSITHLALYDPEHLDDATLGAEDLSQALENYL